MANITKETTKEMRSAISQNNIDKVKNLMAANEGLIDTCPKVFGTWLHVAAGDGFPEMVELFLKLGIDVNERAGLSKAGPLAKASARGHVEIMKLLLSHGARLDVDTASSNPLFKAIYNGKMDAVKFLVESGIDLSVTYDLAEVDAVDACKYAWIYCQDEIAEYLKEKMGKEDEAGMINPIPYHILCMDGIGPEQDKLVKEGQAILRKYEIDPILAPENLVWAPEKLTSHQSTAVLAKLVDALKRADEHNLDYEDIKEILNEFGKRAAER